nr:unnamed protein product [Callosobruchus chinensis]
MKKLVSGSCPGGGNTGRKRSRLWKHFEIVDDLNSKARCKLCNREFSYKTTNSNLKKHLVSKHSADMKTGRRTSSLWKYFEIVDDVYGKARCKLCSRQLSCRSTNSNLKNHLSSKHPTEKVTNEPRATRRERLVEQVLSRRKWSSLWNHFQIVDDLRGKAECNVCGQELSFKTTNTNLKKHLISQHPEEKIFETLQQTKKNDLAWT